MKCERCGSIKSLVEHFHCTPNGKDKVIFCTSCHLEFHLRFPSVTFESLETTRIDFEAFMGMVEGEKVLLT